MKFHFDVQRMQNYSPDIVKWSEEYGMQMKIGKCTVLSSCRSVFSKHYHCKVGNSSIDRLGIIKDLGVTFGNNLKHQIVTMASEMWEFI